MALDLRVTTKPGSSLTHGDVIVNVGRVVSGEVPCGVFHTYTVESGRWDLHSGTMIQTFFEVTFHAADDVFIHEKGN